MRRNLIEKMLLVFLGGLFASGCTNTNEELANALAERMRMESGRLTATGYADIEAQQGNPSQKRILAIRASKIDAYRALSEQIYGLYINGSTTVGDLVVQSDTINSRVEGIIYGAEIESIKPISDTAYEVTLSLPQRVANDLKKLYLQSID